EGRFVRRFVQHQADAKRHHQSREIAAAHNQKADQKSGDPGDDRRGEQTADRFTPSVHREKAGRVRAQPEKCGVTERYDAGVTENQIECDGKQSGDQNLAAEDQIVRNKEIRCDGDQPEDDLERAPTVVGQPEGSRGDGRNRASRFDAGRAHTRPPWPAWRLRDITRRPLRNRAAPTASFAAVLKTNDRASAAARTRGRYLRSCASRRSCSRLRGLASPAALMRASRTTRPEKTAATPPSARR